MKFSLFEGKVFDLFYNLVFICCRIVSEYSELF